MSTIELCLIGAVVLLTVLVFLCLALVGGLLRKSDLLAAALIQHQSSLEQITQHLSSGGGQRPLTLQEMMQKYGLLEPNKTKGKKPNHLKVVKDNEEDEDEDES